MLNISYKYQDHKELNQVHKEWIVNRDYYGTKNRINRKKEERQQFLNSGNSTNIEEHQIESYFESIRDYEYQKHIESIASPIKRNNKTRLKELLRYNQKLSLKIFQAITGICLGTTTKFIHSHIDKLNLNQFDIN